MVEGINSSQIRVRRFSKPLGLPRSWPVGSVKSGRGESDCGEKDGMVEEVDLFLG